MPLRSRICVVAFAVEATPGTAESLDADDAAFVAYNANVEPDEPVDERPGGTGFQQHTAVNGPRAVTVTYESDFTGSGADGTPPFWMTMATCAGMDLSGDVLACGTTTRTATIGVYRDGLLEKISGAAGTFVIPLNSGRAGRIQWTWRGILEDDSDVAVLAPTYPSLVPPKWGGGSASIHSLATKSSTLTLDRGAEIILRENPAKASGYEAAHFVDAKPFITCDPECDLVATKNWQSIKRAQTEGAVSVAVGTAAGNILTIASSTAQVIECPNSERNKLVTKALRLQLNGPAAFTITQS